MDGKYSPGDIVLGNWTLVKQIGAGSYGRVYEARREEFRTVYKAAIKIITIPQNQGEITNARAEGMDDLSVTAYFRSFVEEVVREFDLMSQLKGTANIVSYEDHAVVQHKNNLGWDVIIRMELLTPMHQYPPTRQSAIKLGMDICRALELCEKLNIVHRDVKPENIFVSGMGDYKLGDFGIARTIEKTSSGLSKRGTYEYMAPEVYRGYEYGPSVDIYSLGIVLYKQLNNNRAPFLPDYPEPITFSNRESARGRRFDGEELPAPRNADGKLTEIVLKACAFNAKDRYSGPRQMRKELEAVKHISEESTVVLFEADNTTNKTSGLITEYAFPYQEIQEIVEIEEIHLTRSVFENGKSKATPVSMDDGVQNETESLFKIIEENVESASDLPEGPNIPFEQAFEVREPKKLLPKKYLLPLAAVFSLAIIAIIALVITLSSKGNAPKKDDATDEGTASSQTTSPTAPAPTGPDRPGASPNFVSDGAEGGEYDDLQLIIDDIAAATGLYNTVRSYLTVKPPVGSMTAKELRTALTENGYYTKNSPNGYQWPLAMSAGNVEMHVEYDAQTDRVTVYAGNPMTSDAILPSGTGKYNVPNIHENNDHARDYMGFGFFEFDAEGNYIKGTRTLYRTDRSYTVFEYDANDNVTSRTEGVPDDSIMIMLKSSVFKVFEETKEFSKESVYTIPTGNPDGTYTIYEYDDAGNRKNSYDYNESGEIIRQKSFEQPEADEDNASQGGARPKPPDTPDDPAPTEEVETAPILTDIAIKAKPNKLTYLVGESLDLEGLEVRAIYDDGSDKIVSISCSPPNGSNLSTAGEKTITVSYTEGDVVKTAEFTVTVNEIPKLDRIAVTPPSKTIYKLNETFDSSGMSVKAYYTDGKSETVAPPYNIAGFNSATAGEKSITVTFSDGGISKTGAFTVTVVGRFLYLDLAKTPSKKTYNVGESLDLDDMELYAVYEGVSPIRLTKGQYKTEGFDSSSTGEKMLFVVYVDGGTEHKAPFSYSVKRP